MQILDTAMKLICDYFNTTPIAMRSAARKRPLVTQRQCAMKFMFERIAKQKGISQGYVSKHYFKRDHTTLIHACQLIDNFHDIEAPEWHEYAALCRHTDIHMVSELPCKTCEVPTLYPVFRLLQPVTNFNHIKQVL